MAKIMFFQQVWALIRKDAYVILRNRKSSCAEVVFPLVVGCLVGLFILLIQLVKAVGGEYKNLMDVPSIEGLASSDPTWVGLAPQDLFSTRMANYYGSVGVSTTLANDWVTVLEDLTNERATTSVRLGLSRNDTLNILTATCNFNATLANNPWAVGVALGVSIGNAQHATGGGGGAAVDRTTTASTFILPFNLRAIFSSSGAIFMIYAFVPSLILTGGRLVEEKRLRVRETLKVMGLSDAAYVVANYATSLARMGIASALIPLALAAFHCLSPTDIPAMIAICAVFSLSLVSFAQAMPALFHASLWSNVASIFFLAGSAAVSSVSTAWAGRWAGLAGALSPVAFFYAALPFLSAQTTALSVSISQAVGTMAVDAVGYWAIGAYVRAVAPGEFGVPKHPLFFLRWLWVKREGEGEGGGGRKERGEGEGDRIVLEGLTKFYGDVRDVPAVDRLSLSVKRGEIFALLGHNGAGKTTTISILTGMTTPTSYVRATVEGYDIRTDMDHIRRSIGLCPQFDVLFNDLTARQHLSVFAAIKGKADEERINYLMKHLELPDDNTPSSAFSGGMKRRLSVGNALLGGDIIFLDEPSSGLDPLSRRKLWDLLKEEVRGGKTIVLTTHFMEEADYLGDRIAIMSRGKLYCCNTSSQLKEQFGVGYYLNLVKQEDGTADPSKAVKVIQKFLPEATLHHDSSGSTTILLPVGSVEHFGDVLAEVEQSIRTWGFSSYGLAMNTLEDVFVTISQREEAAHSKGHVELNTPEVETEDPKLERLFEMAESVPHWRRVVSQIGAEFRKKFLMLRRSRRMQAMVIVFPLLFISIAFLTMQPQQAAGSLPSADNSQINFNDLHLVHLNLRDQAVNNRIMANFTALYRRAYPKGSLTVYTMNSYDDFSVGKYIPMRSLSFIGGFQAPQIVGGFLPHSTRLEPPAYQNLTVIVNTNYPPVVMASLTAMYAAAVEMAAGSGAVYAAVVPFGMDGLDAPPPPPPAGEGAREKKYQFTQVGLYMVIATVQLVSGCVTPMADDMQRSIYSTCRAQGMTSLAYFIGNFCFDVMCCMWPLGILTVWLFAKPVGAFYGAITFWVLLAGFLFTVHVVLQGYVLVTYVRGLKPITYTGILHVANLAMFGGPYLLQVALNSVSLVKPAMHILKPLILATTPPAAFYHLMDNASDLTERNTRASYILTFSFSTVATAYGYIALVVELALPTGLLVAFVANKRKAHPTPTRRTATHSEMESLLVNSTARDDDDVDVAQEARKSATIADDTMVCTRSLRKKFGKLTAVDRLSLHIHRGECFGLLGPNGAGKTTTCNLLLRHFPPTEGNILFPYANADTSTPIEEAFSRMRLGVCNQIDTVWEYLTAHEHLEHYLRLRLTSLYRREDWAAYIERAIAKVQLTDDSKLAGEYSGGMKRKLVVSLAVCTGSLVVFLDEPSTGMDPFSRRALWKIIRDALSAHRVVILTTHSMEEADAVCGRIAIITQGRLRCIGTSQHLKNRFGSGYSLTLSHAVEADVTAIDAAVKEKFPLAAVQEVLGTQRRYALGTLNSLAETFQWLRSVQAVLRLAHYGISQTSSLEAIFLSFVGTSESHE